MFPAKIILFALEGFVLGLLVGFLIGASRLPNTPKLLFATGGGVGFGYLLINLPLTIIRSIFVTSASGGTLIGIIIGYYSSISIPKSSHYKERKKRTGISSGYSIGWLLEEIFYPLKNWQKIIRQALLFGLPSYIIILILIWIRLSFI